MQQTYKAKPILPLLKLVQKSDGVDFARVRQILDNKTSKRLIYDKSGVATSTKQYTLKGLNREQCQEFVEFFKSVNGRQVSFWVPSLFQDAKPTTVFGAGLTSIEVEDTLFSSVWCAPTASDPRNTLASVRHDGFVQPFTILSSVPDNVRNVETLNLEAPLTSTITPGSFICIMSLHRFAEDSLTVKALTQHLFELSFNLTTVKG